MDLFTKILIISITHNMSEDFLKFYDEIIYMENGEIIEKASYQELIAKKGFFYDFINIKK